MSELTPLFAVLVMLAATLAMVSVWAPRRIEIKVGAVVVAFALMATTYAAMLDLLSRPKPTRFEWWTSRAAEATVVGSSFDESRAIYCLAPARRRARTARLRSALGPARGGAAAGGGTDRGRAAIRPPDA